MTYSTTATDFRVSCVVHLHTNLGKSTALYYITLEKWHISNKTHQSMRFQYVLVACKAIVLGVTII